MEDPHGTIFVSIPSLLDASVAPDGCHVMHVFTPDWVDKWTVRSTACCCGGLHALVQKLTVRLLVINWGARPIGWPSGRW